MIAFATAAPVDSRYSQFITPSIALKETRASVALRTRARACSRALYASEYKEQDNDHDEQT